MSQGHWMITFATVASPCLFSISVLPALARAAVPARHHAESVEISVSVADLDLSSEAGSRTADLRLREAARIGCLRFYDSRKDDGWATHSGCFRESIASARHQLQQRALPLVSQGDIHDFKTVPRQP